MANDAHLEMLRRGASIWNEWRTSTGLQKPDFEGADLSVDSVGPLDLNGINLASALLNGVSLTGQRLGSADLQFAQMQGAKLRSVNLNEANLREANLRSAELQPKLVPFREDLSGDPSGAMSNLVSEIAEEGGDWHIVERGSEPASRYGLPTPFIVEGRRMGSPSSLQRAALDGADLREANLFRSDLTNSSLSNAELKGANLQSASLKGASLTGANMREARLSILDLSKSDLASLPQEITTISELTELNLRDNRLQRLPQEIGWLTSLETLDLRNNDLRELPSELANLPSLKGLYLHGNPQLGIPPEILGEEPSWSYRWQPGNDPQAILTYYARTLVARRPLNEAKLILVGYGGVGKTSVVDRLVNQSFDINRAKTEGISINEWRITLRDNEAARLNVWDFGGQEIMHATHQFFLTERSIYLLVLSGRQGREEADAEYWLRLIESFGKRSPVIIVLNKIKEHYFDLNRRALQEKFPSIRACIQTDCKDGTGFPELLEAVERETDRLEHLRDAFPESWFKIKDYLSRLQNNYLTLAEYRGVCRQYGETDKDAQDALAVYLHALGIALNYRDDPRLLDMNILNPHWVTQGIYAILNSQTLALQNGIIRVEQIAAILDQEAYPETTHVFLCQLMKRFELCFELADEAGTYLIPDLLDRQEPSEASDFIAPECLNFEYEYPILPEGLLPRFIVRTYTLSNRQRRWRTGVILAFERNLAIVKADLQDKRVTIRVTGPHEGRRSLLAIIRSDFDGIHKSFSFAVREVVPIPQHPGLCIGYNELLVMEEHGYTTYPLVAGTTVMTLDVKNLLAGVEISQHRRKTATASDRRRAQLFYSYSHRDERLRDELETHLKLLQREGLIEGWHDRQIVPGQEWENEINASLEAADIILLLVSANFIASDYAYGIEMQRAINRHESGDARVIPVILRDVDWQAAPFGKLQALPKNGKPVTKWSSRDTAWRDVSLGIRRVVQELSGRS
jgi:internalin A